MQRFILRREDISSIVTGGKERNRTGFGELGLEVCASVTRTFSVKPEARSLAGGGVCWHGRHEG